MKNFTKRFKGFTLVEVLIVIIIVGILIAALLPRLTGSQQRARDTARTAAVNQIANAVSLLIADEGSLATSGEICLNGLDDLASADSVDLSSYLASLPTDPQSGSHDNAGSLTNFAACNDGFATIVDTSNGRSLVICADMESGTVGNYAAFDADANTGLAAFQALTAGTAQFCTVVRG